MNTTMILRHFAVCLLLVSSLMATAQERRPTQETRTPPTSKEESSPTPSAIERAPRTDERQRPTTRPDEKGKLEVMFLQFNQTAGQLLLISGGNEPRTIKSDPKKPHDFSQQLLNLLQQQYDQGWSMESSSTEVSSDAKGEWTTWVLSRERKRQ